MALEAPEGHTLVEQAEQLGLCLRIAVGHKFEFIEIDLAQENIGAGIGAFESGCHGVGLGHVVAVVLVVGENQQVIFPVAFRQTGRVVGNLVDGGLGLGDRHGRDAAHCYAEFVAALVHAGAVFEKSENVVGGVGVVLVEARVGEPCREHGVAERAHYFGLQSGVEGRTAEKHGVAQAFARGGRLPAVVEHFQHLAECLGVGRARGEFVVDLARSEHEHVKRVGSVGAVHLCEPFGFRAPFGGGEDHHVGHILCVDILAGYLCDHLWRGEGAGGLPGGISACGPGVAALPSGETA